MSLFFDSQLPIFQKTFVQQKYAKRHDKHEKGNRYRYRNRKTSQFMNGDGDIKSVRKINIYGYWDIEKINGTTKI